MGEGWREGPQGILFEMLDSLCQSESMVDGWMVEWVVKSVEVGQYDITSIMYYITIVGDG